MDSYISCKTRAVRVVVILASLKLSFLIAHYFRIIDQVYMVIFSLISYIYGEGISQTGGLYTHI